LSGSEFRAWSSWSQERRSAKQRLPKRESASMRGPGFETRGREAVALRASSLSAPRASFPSSCREPVSSACWFRRLHAQVLSTRVSIAASLPRRAPIRACLRRPVHGARTQCRFSHGSTTPFCSMSRIVDERAVVGFPRPGLLATDNRCQRPLLPGMDVLRDSCRAKQCDYEFWWSFGPNYTQIRRRILAWPLSCSCQYLHVL